MHRSRWSAFARWLPAAALVVLLVGCGAGGTSSGPAPSGTVVTVGSPRTTAPAATTPVATTAAAVVATPTAPTRAVNGTASPVATPGAATTPAGGGSTMQDHPAARAAVADLARQRSVDASRIQVVGVESVEWSDSSLGCPEPGRAYAQVITPGFRIRLTLDGQPVVYHADRANRVILCANPRP